MIDGNVSKILAGFTHEGTPLGAIVGSKQEWGVTILCASMLANENLASQMTAEEMVDAAITYATIIQKRLGHYQNNQVHSLERLMEG